ncbi:MAG: hydroxyisourate hydrolase, partial [Cyanobacteria bacterium J06635_11]
MGWLSTHVLDTANGAPAADMKLILWRITAQRETNGSDSIKGRAVSDSEGKSEAIFRSQSNYQ